LGLNLEYCRRNIDFESNVAAICAFGAVNWGYGVVFGRNFDLGKKEIGQNFAIWAEILNFAAEILI
jgi:hypothetical protein